MESSVSAFPSRSKKKIFAMLLMVVLVGMAEHIRPQVPCPSTCWPCRVVSFLLACWCCLGTTAGCLFIRSPVGSPSANASEDKLCRLQAFDLVAMLGYLVVIFFHAWWAVLLGAILFLSWSEVSLPATMSPLFVLHARQPPRAGVSLYRRVSMTLLLGGFLILWWGKQDGSRASPGS